MNARRRVIAVAAAAGVALVPALAGATSANAAPGTKSLASVLLKDTTKQGNPSYDHNSADFDILTAAVLTVLAKKPNSPVSVLTDGSVKLTAFLPTDAAFEAAGIVPSASPVGNAPARRNTDRNVLRNVADSTFAAALRAMGLAREPVA